LQLIAVLGPSDLSSATALLHHTSLLLLLLLLTVVCVQYHNSMLALDLTTGAVK
jgi:hypothetical protein